MTPFTFSLINPLKSAYGLVKIQEIHEKSTKLQADPRNSLK